MKRQWLANAAVAAPAMPGAPSIGYPQDGASPTIPGAQWYHMVTEEILGVIVAGGLTPDADTLTQLRDAIIALSTVPSGAVVWVAKSSAPTGYLKANGAAVSRTTYAALFAAIGTVFGVGDGATTFNLPDLRGEFIRGWDDSRGVDSGRALGSTQADAFKSHTHVDNTSSVSGGSLNRAYANNANDSSGTQSTVATGGAETRPRNVALLACIKF